MVSSSTRILALLLVGIFQTPVHAQPTNTLRPWTDYKVIMWMGDTAYRQPDKLPLFFDRLREMGINTAMLHGDGNVQPLLQNKFPYYVENIVNKGLCMKWSSKVQDWDKVVTEWAKNGRPDSALVRDYCLDDPEWRNWARERMREAARKNVPHQPVAYDIRDELSTTISANPFDYDFNPIALRQFRGWLKNQYRDLRALNTEWGTRFEEWDAVRPFTTDQVKDRMASGEAMPRGKPDWADLAALRFQLADARKKPMRWNFAPWADFRTYMDISLARTLDDLRQAAREVDPRTPVGVEGTQMPHAFGGYDLWRLSQALDWVEPYDIGNAREIFGSFMPGKTLMTTVFEKDTPHASRRLWHLLLEGDRGCIIWWSEDCVDWKSPDYQLTSKAKELEPVLREMASPLCQLFLRAKRVSDPVFIHYSQASIQADWLIESTVDGSTWLRRFSSHEASHNRQAHIRNSWLKLFQDLGFSPRFISSDEIEQGALTTNSNSTVILPCSWALSTREGEVLRKAALSGSVVFFDGTPGVFNEHGRLLYRSPLEEFFTPGSETASVAVFGNATRDTLASDIAKYAVHRLRDSAAALKWTQWAAQTLGAKKPGVVISPDARVRTHRFTFGKASLLAFERNIDWQMSEELKQAGGNEALEKPVGVEARLERRRHLYDLRTGRYLGRADTLNFTLDPWQPSLFALTDEELEGESPVSVLLAQ